MLHTAIQRARQVRRTGQAGFTLIELLIVIVILGVLAAIVVFSVTGITNKGDKSACQAQISTVDTAFEALVAQATGTAPTAAGTTIGDLKTAGLIHNAPTTNTIDGKDFGSAVTVAAVDGYSCA